MSADLIYGTWDEPNQRPPSRPELGALDARLQWLWHHLAAQRVGRADQENNLSLTQRKNEIIELWKLFVLKNPAIILEIGLAQGGTMAGWCQLARDDALFITVDRDPNDCRPRRYESVHPDIANPDVHRDTDAGGGVHHLARAQQRIVVIKGWTYDPEVQRKLIEALDGRKADFIMHDCSHSAEMFKTDFEWLWPLLAEGGIMAAHDIDYSEVPELNKRDYWNWIKDNVRYSAVYEYLGHSDSDSMGIGILIK